MDQLRYRNLDITEAYDSLQSLNPVSLKQVLTPERINAYSIAAGGGLTYNFAAKQVDETILDTLQQLSDEQQLIDKYQAVANGEIMNTGEKRRVLHHLTRGQLGKEVIHEGKNLRDFYVEQQKRIADFAEKVHSGQLRGSTGKPFDTVVQVGIGGSDLGPRALYLALKNEIAAVRSGKKPYLKASFISNIDPDDANEILDHVDFESTLFIIVSKSGTTQETLTNKKLVTDRMIDASVPNLRPEKHMIAVTGETSPMASSSEYLESFYIDDFIGGRYSSTSAVGGTVLSLTLGSDVFQEIVDGAHETDTLSLSENTRKNAALMDAMIGIFERTILGYPATAVLPYSQALNRFPAHLQQLDMESNGKQVNRAGGPLTYSTGPIIFGEPGTNGQHSFYQLLHQGTDIIPLQFIGFHDSQTMFDIECEGGTGQQKLNANLAAQIIAFALGKADDNPNKNFPGEKPSSLIYGTRCTPRSLGALLAHFENKVMFQGLAWNINSFDQEGVQLGKLLTTQILTGQQTDERLQSYTGLLKLY